MDVRDRDQGGLGGSGGNAMGDRRHSLPSTASTEGGNGKHSRSRSIKREDEAEDEAEAEGEEDGVDGGIGGVLLDLQPLSASRCAQY